MRLRPRRHTGEKSSPSGRSGPVQASVTFEANIEYRKESVSAILFLFFLIEFDHGVFRNPPGLKISLDPGTGSTPDTMLGGGNRSPAAFSTIRRTGEIDWRQHGHVAAL